MPRPFLLCLAAVVWLSLWSVASAGEPQPRLALQIIRLKPGESQFIEMALPAGDFRAAGASGRSDLYVDFAAPGAKEFQPAALGKPTGKEHFKAGPHRVAEEVDVRWSETRSGVEFQAGSNAPKGQVDVRIRYTNFGGKEHLAGFRVIVVAEKDP